MPAVMSAPLQKGVRMAQTIDLPEAKADAAAPANASYPFWRLQMDGIWTVRDAERFTRNNSGDRSVRQLRSARAEGGFSD